MGQTAPQHAPDRLFPSYMQRRGCILPAKCVPGPTTNIPLCFSYHGHVIKHVKDRCYCTFFFLGSVLESDTSFVHPLSLPCRPLIRFETALSVAASVIFQISSIGCAHELVQVSELLPEKGVKLSADPPIARSILT